MNKQEQKKSIEERHSQLLTEFVTYFVKEFEAKLHAYNLILEGKTEKAGQYSDTFSGMVGQAIGGTLAGLIGLFFGVPAVASLGAAGGKELAEKIGHAIGSEYHRKKVIRLNNLVNRFQNDKANFRRELVGAGFDIFQSYEFQFMKVTTDQGQKKAMQLLARDATNRLISYNGEENCVEKINLLGVIRGISKIEAVMGVPIASGIIKTPGFKVETSLEKRSGKKISEFFYLGIAGNISKSEKKWSTASMFEKVGIVRERAYYEKKDGTCKVFKYGYRRILNYEDWNKLKDEYKPSKLRSPFKSYRYILTFEDSERQKIITCMLDKINLNDKDLMESRIRELIEEAIKEINSLKKQKDLHIEHSKILEDISSYLNTVNVNEYLNELKQYFEKNDKDHEKIIESIEVGREENKEEHKKTQELIQTALVKPQSKGVEESIWFDVKDPVDQFTGRKKELDELDWKIQRNPNQSTVITRMTVISGLGGVGKTELARRYVQEYGKDFDNILWINSETEATLIDSFRRLAKDKLQIETRDENGKEKNIKYIAEDVYMFLSKKKTIFIFDNVEKNEDFKKILDTFRSTLKHPSVKPYILITSRNREWEKGIEVLNLSVLTLQDAIDLVKTSIDAEDEEIKPLVEKLQYFPLAIQQAMAYIEHQAVVTTYDISKYIQEYEKKTQDLLDSEIFKGIDNDYEKTTFTTWKITIDKIANNKDHGKLASDILNVIAYIAPENIRREMFLVMANRDETNLTSAVRLLVTYSMLNGEKNQNILNIHRLVQEVIRLELKKQKKEEKVLKKAFDLMEANFFYGSDKIEDYVLMLPHLEAFELHLNQLIKRGPKKTANIAKVYLQNILKWKHVAYKNLGDPQKRKVLLERALAIQEKLDGPGNLDVAKTKADLGNAYGALGDFRKQRKLLQRALAIGEKHYGSEPLVASILANLSEVYGHLGDLKKKTELLERAVAIQKNHYEPDYFVTAKTLAKLGNAYGALGDPQKKKEFQEKHFEAAPKLVSLINALGNSQKKKKFLEKALAIQEKQFGSEHFEVAPTLVSLGNAYGALGDPQKQKELLERALAIQETHFGSKHFQVPPILASLGNAYGALGYYQKQKELLERALAIQETHFGSDHFEVVPTLVSLSNANGSLGDPRKQKELLERALAVQEKYFRSDHFEMATTLTNLGNAYGALGDPKKQKKLLERVLAIQEKHFGLEHFEVAPTLVSLGNANGALGDHRKQKELLERVLAIQEKYFKSDHFEVATTLTNLGNAYGALGDPQKRKELLKRALAIQEKHFGLESLEVAPTLVSLSNAYGALGDPRKQKELLERVLAIQEKYFKSDHFEVATTLTNLGNAYGALGDPQKRKELLERALAIQEKHFGSKHFQVPPTLASLGNAYGALGDPQKRKELLERALAIQEKHFGSKHFQVPPILASLGNAYGALGYYQKQKELLERALAIQETHFGSEHFEVATTLTNLGNAYGALGDPQKRKELLERALAIQEKHFGSEHFEVAPTLVSLGNAYGALGDPQKQKELLERALAIQEKHFGLESFEVAPTLVSLGNAYSALDDPQKLKKLLKRALAIQEKHFGSEHFEVAPTLANLGNAYGDLSDIQKQKDLLERALAIEEKYFGSDHFEVVPTLVSLSNANGSLGDPRKQKELLERALAVQEKHYGS